MSESENEPLSQSQKAVIPETLLQQMNIGSWSWEIEPDVVTWSPALYRIFGVDPADDPPNWEVHTRLYTPASFDALRQAVEHCIKTGEPFTLELDGIRLDNGESVFIEGHGAALRDSRGHVCRLFGICVERTAKREAVERIEASELKFRSIFNATPVGLVLCGWEKTTIANANPAFAALAGCSTEKLRHRNLTDFVDMSQRGKPTLPTSFPGAFSTQLHRIDGAVRAVDVTISRLGFLTDYHLQLVVVLDMQPLLTAHTDREHAELAAQRLLIDERAQIAKAMHDGVGQQMTSITLITGKHLENPDLPEGLQRDLRQIQERAQKTMERCRSIARGLFPHEVSPEGWHTALRRMATALSESFKIRIDCMLPEIWRPASDQVAANLYLIAQEAILNAIRHGRARRVEIRVEAGSETSHLIIEDDGNGIAPEQSMDGSGIFIMRRRAQNCRGKLEIQPRPQGGTRVTCKFSG